MTDQVSPQDLSFTAGLEHFKEKGGKEADLMQRQPLQYLKAKQTHKLRILPGLAPQNPVEWFIACTRHYLGNAAVAPIRRAGSRVALICPQSIGGEACFCCHCNRYLEASGSTLASEFLARDIALVNAYRANEAEPRPGPFLITKTNMSQLTDLWKDGYVFFHPQQGCAVTFKPIENMNMFSVNLDPKQVAIPEAIFESAKSLPDLISTLLIDYSQMRTWFIEPFVEVVEHFVKTGEARPLDWQKLASSQAENVQNHQAVSGTSPVVPPQGTPPPQGVSLNQGITPPVQQASSNFVSPVQTDIPFEGQSPQRTVNESGSQNNGQADFLSELKDKVGRL